MLNPKVEEVYGKRTAECFQLLADEAQKRNNYVGLWGVKSMKKVQLPRLVCFDRDDIVLNDLVVNAFINATATFTMMEQDAFDYLPYVDGKDIWGDLTEEMTDLWVQ